jgi:hypothetical protein
MAEIKWEPIIEVAGSAFVASTRLWVPGGWIVRSVVTRMDAGAHCSQIFVSDPNHEWEQSAAGRG